MVRDFPVRHRRRGAAGKMQEGGGPPAGFDDRGHRRGLEPPSACSTASRRRERRDLRGEAAGGGVEHRRARPATISGGKNGVLHGNRTYLLKNDDGQITDAHSISAGPTIQASAGAILAQRRRRCLHVRQPYQEAPRFQLTLPSSRDHFPRFEKPGSRHRQGGGEIAAEKPRATSWVIQPVRARRQGHLHRGGAPAGRVVRSHARRSPSRKARPPARITKP